VVSGPAARSAAEKKSLHATERDTEANLRRREEYLAQIGALSPEKLIFLDESGVTTSLTRLRARCEGGGRIREATPGGHWKILTILGAMSVRGMVAAMTIEEATDGDIFLAFVEQVLSQVLQPGDVVVMDNLGAHKTVRVRQRIEKTGAQLLYLPAYSPELNPIEKAWSKLKQLLRSAKARNREALEAAITDALPQLTPDNATAWFRACGIVYRNS
jgi:transposase